MLKRFLLILKVLIAMPIGFLAGIIIVFTVPCLETVNPDGSTFPSLIGILIILASPVLFGFLAASPVRKAKSAYNKYRFELIEENNKMNRSLSLDSYYEQREKVIDLLNKLKPWEDYISNNKQVTPIPSKGLRLMEENQDLQVYSALERIEKISLDLIKDDGIPQSNYLSIQLSRHRSKMSQANIEKAEAIIENLKKAESVHGTIQEADCMEGHEFEHWCANLLGKNGFYDIQVTQASGDQGVDIIALKDGIHYAIQCKCYSQDPGNGPVQEIHTGKYIYHCQVGAVMTNRYFTKGAKEAADATGVLLWDRDKLKEFIERAK